MLSFVESEHPVFKGTMARGALKSKEARKASTHFNAEPQTAESLLRTIIAASQLSIYRAVAHWCSQAAGAGDRKEVRNLNLKWFSVT